MTKSVFSFRNTALIGALALASLSGCDKLMGSGAAADKGAEAPAAEAAAEEEASNLDPILANPQVGDLWSGEMSAFSDQFARDGEDANKRAFGAMKVIAVTDDRVTIITESGAWDNASDARNELRGNLSGISWDPNEEIPVNRSELAQLVEDGKIVETRRMEGGGASAAAPSGKPAASE